MKTKRVYYYSVCSALKKKKKKNLSQVEGVDSGEENLWPLDEELEEDQMKA